jgi:molybdopterin-guanine dinucleotide biosynthesis protein A
MGLLPVTGFVLAGGRSVRMGRDKALIELGGRTLIERAVAKLGEVCAAVRILGDSPGLGRYAPLVPDLHPGCGPMGGIEAALAGCATEWALVLPVDVPFLPGAFLGRWAGGVLERGRMGVRLGMCAVDGQPQPAVVMIHRDLGSYLTQSIARGELKLYPALVAAASGLARDSGLEEGRVLEVHGCAEPEARWWFANLNTPEDLSQAEQRVEALDA